jgi:hypothetical protein
LAINLAQGAQLAQKLQHANAGITKAPDKLPKWQNLCPQVNYGGFGRQRSSCKPRHQLDPSQGRSQMTEEGKGLKCLVTGCL